MKVPLQGISLAPKRSSLRTALLATAAAVAILVIAAAWPTAGRAPSVLSSAVAEAPGPGAAPVAATAPSRDPSLPDAATALAHQPIYVEGPPPPTF